MHFFPHIRRIFEIQILIWEPYNPGCDVSRGLKQGKMPGLKIIFRPCPNKGFGIYKHGRWNPQFPGLRTLIPVFHDSNEWNKKHRKLGISLREMALNKMKPRTPSDFRDTWRSTALDCSFYHFFWSHDWILDSDWLKHAKQKHVVR